MRQSRVLLHMIMLVMVSVSSTLATAQLRGLDRDAKELSGVVSLDFGDMLGTSKQQWVIVNVIPGERKFRGDPEPYLVSGQGILDDKQGLIVELFGRLTLVHPLTKTSLTGTEDYDWVHSGYSGPHFNQNYDQPFAYGGTMVCCVHPDQKGADRYGPAYLIPPAWEPQLVAAFGYYKAHATWFQPPAPGVAAKPETTRQLRRLLSDPNPFLVVQAVRALAALDQAPGTPTHGGPKAKVPTAGNLDADALAQQAVTARGLRQALLAFLVLNDSPKTGRQIAGTVLLHAVQAATDPRQIAGIALAVYVLEDPARGYVNPEVVALDKQLIIEKTTLADGELITNIYPKVGGLTDNMSRSDAYKYIALVVDLTDPFG